MIDAKISAVMAIAEKHLIHLQNAMHDMSAHYPFTQNFIINLSEDDLRILDTMTGRFSKLQDLLGTKIIDIYLESVNEPIIGQSILDKINKLEKLYIIDSADLWTELRDVRNHISHEYPDNPQLAADHLNDAYKFALQLIAIYHKLKSEIYRIREK